MSEIDPSLIQTTAKPRSIVYIDGFNLYYGAIRGTRTKWLNIQSYFERLRAAEDIYRIYYFSALVTGSGRARQETYLRAIGTLPLVTTVLGKYKLKSVCCGVTQCTHGTSRYFQTPEEKRTDVNIAVQMVTDAFQNNCDNPASP